MAKTCVFNINGTLLDFAALDPFFEKIFGAAVFRQLWLQTVLHTSACLTLSDRFVDFSKVGERTLESLAKEKGRELSSESLAEFKRALENLPAFPDVRTGLEVLRNAGYRLVGLTNSGKAAASAPLTQAGLREYFDDIYSVEAVESYKPALSPYLFAAEKLKAVPKQLWLVAAHAWDTMGAHQAGFKTGLLMRPENGFNDNFPKPDVKGATLAELATEIQNRDRTLLQKVFGAGKAAKPEARPAS